MVLSAYIKSDCDYRKMSHDFEGRGPGEGREGKFSIHSSEAIEFMRKSGASNLVLNILEKGYRLPLTETPKNYFEENNESAKQNIEVLRSKVIEWEKEGHVKRVPTRPPVCSPMSVASKVDLATGKLKLRPCLDASRYLNGIMSVEKVKLEDLSSSQKQPIG